MEKCNFQNYDVRKIAAMLLFGVFPLSGKIPLHRDGKVDPDHHKEEFGHAFCPADKNRGA